MRIKLTEQDRARLGVPEVMEYDSSRPKLSEIRAISRPEPDGPGFKGWSVLERALNGEDLDDGLAALAVFVWLAVRRHTDVSWADFDLDLLGLEAKGDEDPNSSAPTGAQ